MYGTYAVLTGYWPVLFMGVIQIRIPKNPRNCRGRTLFDTITTFDIADVNTFQQQYDVNTVKQEYDISLMDTVLFHPYSKSVLVFFFCACLEDAHHTVHAWNPHSLSAYLLTCSYFSPATHRCFAAIGSECDYTRAACSWWNLQTCIGKLQDWDVPNCEFRILKFLILTNWMTFAELWLQFLVFSIIVDGGRPFVFAGGPLSMYVCVYT